MAAQVCRNMAHFVRKKTIRKFIIIQVLLHLASMSYAQYPWRQLKIRHFCLLSTYHIEIKSEGCTPEMVTVNACLGVCPSYVRIIASEPYFKNLCHCCRAMEHETVEFALQNCKNPQKSVVSVQSAKRCSCVEIDCN